MNQVHYKYKLGQKVFYKTFTWEYVPVLCKDCGGTGVLVRKDGQEITCPTCRGKKITSTDRRRIESVNNDYVEHIKINIEHPDYINIGYVLENSDEYGECELFESETDAVATFEVDVVCESSTTAVVESYANDYKTLFTNIPKERWPVHRTHCCKKHGCKYGDYDNCPVCLGLIEQDHACEECKIEAYDDLPF